MKKLISNSARQTKKLGELLSQELRGGEVICLEGELGSGKTTFAQGVLAGLEIKGPYTSPTFMIIKKYNVKIKNKKPKTKKDLYKIQNTKYGIRNIYHIDVYRVCAADILALGWEEVIKDKSAVVLVEWADRIKKIIPKRALNIKFRWKSENRRELLVR